MKGKFTPKGQHPYTRSRTEQDDEDLQLMSFQVPFPDERPEPRQLRNLPKANKSPRTYEIKKKNGQTISNTQRPIELPKIDQCFGSQAKTDTPQTRTQLPNIIPDNEFLEMRELTENPQRARAELPNPFAEKQVPSRQWIRSEEKQYRRRSPPPIILESPLINRSNRYLKVCRSKAYSLYHRNSIEPLEMTFYPPKNGGLPAL